MSQFRTKSDQNWTISRHPPRSKMKMDLGHFEARGARIFEHFGQNPSKIQYFDIPRWKNWLILMPPEQKWVIFPLRLSEIRRFWWRFSAKHLLIRCRGVNYRSWMTKNLNKCKLVPYTPGKMNDFELLIQFFAEKVRKWIIFGGSKLTFLD